MSDDKRRRARVQGTWAAPPAVGTGSQRPQRETRQPVLPSGSKLTFQRAEQQVIRKKPSEIFIDKEGQYVLSETGDGKNCCIQFYPDFVGDADERRQVFETLKNGVPWQEKWGVTNGERFRMPRLMAWYGPIAYRFSGTSMPPNNQWPPVIDYLRERIRASTPHDFNSVLLNLYRDGRDSVSWHSDDELLMGVHPVIASLSFGDTRAFQMRQRTTTEDGYDYAQHVRIPLKDGCLLIMEGETQAYWQHRVPKEYHDRKVRINLTFRTVFEKI